MGIDAQGDVRLGVAEALRDGDYVYAFVDQLRRMGGVPQRVERHVRHVDVVSKIGLCRRYRVWGVCVSCLPCLPSPADKPPSGSSWIHEIKHDDFRRMARRDPVGIRLITRRGNDWTTRYPLVVEAVNHLKVRSCRIDGEVVCCDEKGVTAFHLLRHRRNELPAFLYAFEMLDLNERTSQGAYRGAQGHAGQHPAEEPTWGTPERAHGAPGRRRCLSARLQDGVRGIVSKRLGSRYRSGRSSDWLKFKSPEEPAVTRKAEEDWAK
jgi:bifunctional non-homologous end joining protein LigD